MNNQSVSFFIEFYIFRETAFEITVIINFSISDFSVYKALIRFFNFLKKQETTNTFIVFLANKYKSGLYKYRVFYTDIFYTHYFIYCNFLLQTKDSGILLCLAKLMLD